MQTLRKTYTPPYPSESRRQPRTHPALPQHNPRVRRLTHTSSVLCLSTRAIVIHPPLHQAKGEALPISRAAAHVVTETFAEADAGAEAEPGHANDEAAAKLAKLEDTNKQVWERGMFHARRGGGWWCM